MSRVMIAATGSGSGKTTIVCGLCQCIKDMGLMPLALKCGPDYIDSMFHSRVLNMKTGNLDSWFCDENTIKELLFRKESESDITIIEGVMGYYDGQGFSTKGSSYEIADITDTPVILVVNCRGMSNSIGAVLKGYKEYIENNHIQGVIFNNLSSKLYKDASTAAHMAGIKPLGYLPVNKAIALESRHLGLVTSDEIEHFKEKVDTIAALMKESIDIKGIIELGHTATKCKTGCELNASDSKACKKTEKSNKEDIIHIAVARDEAFCFLYEDNLEFLREHGCEPVYFSPLRDKKLPDDIDGLLLYGGYPELHAKELSDNVSMRNDIADKIRGGLPCIAECGGYLYLHKKLEAPDKKVYPMAGVIDGTGYNAGRLQRFGYMTLTAGRNTMLADKGKSFSAHEFHYWNSDCKGDTYSVTKASDGSVEIEGYGSDTLYAGFPHIYFPGNKEAARRFIKTCRCYRHKLSGIDKDIEKLAAIFPELTTIKASDNNAMKQAEKHWDGIAKPLHGLGMFEDMIVQIAGIQGNADVSIDKKAVVVMCADNGIVEEGVTQTGQEVTAIVSCNMADGISSVCRMAAYANADVIPVNVGIAMDTLEDGTDVGTYKGLVNKRVMSGTNNFLKEPAMSEEQLIQAIYAGITQVKECYAWN